MNELLILDNFIDEKTCDEIIALYTAFETVKPIYDGRKIITNPKNPVIQEFLNDSLTRLNSLLQLKRYIRIVFWSLFEKGSFIPVHIDHLDPNRKNDIAAVFYLNDDFSGGEIFFPKLDKTYHPKKGTVVVFPCNDPLYEHGVNKITQGTRYSIAIEITEIEEAKVYDFL